MFSFGVRQIGLQTIVARKSGYVSIQKQVNFTIGFLKRNEQKLITIPMLKEEDPETAKAYAVLSYDGNLRGI